MNIKKTVFLSAFTAALGYAAAGIYKVASIKAMPMHSPSDEDGGLIHVLLLCFENPEFAVSNNIVVNNNYIIRAMAAAKKYIDGRFDCMDFRMQTLLRLAYLYSERIKAISPQGWELLEQTFLNAKFWMTEPGNDSACYWSENHQLLFACAEFLAGQLWQDKVFSNDGALGIEHMHRAEKRIESWAQQRFYYGYSEFNSNNYYLFDAAPASNFIQFAQGCAKLKERMKICLDLLLYDIASGIFDFGFTVPTGRAYSYNLAGGKCDRIRGLTDFIWNLNNNHMSSTQSMLVNIVSMLRAKDKNGEPFYEVPPVIIEIGRDSADRIIKSSTSMDINELVKKGLVGHEDDQVMCQLSIEAFTNPQVIYNTFTYFKKNGLFTNKMVNYFRFLDLKMFNSKRVMTAISKKLNPMPNGIAMQRVNLYKYRTAYSMLASVHKYYPGMFGAQQFLSCANFGGNSIIFTNHPARDTDKGNTQVIPGYWAGFGRAPHIAQEKNIQIMLYDIPKISGFLELYMVPQYTHTYLLEAFFDEVCINHNYAFARKGGAYCAMIGSGRLSYLEFDAQAAKALQAGLEEFKDKHFDLIQRGNHQFWIYELSDEKRESFEGFKKRIKGNPLSFNGRDYVIYVSNGVSYELVFGGDFTVDNKTVSPQYKRFECDYITAERETDLMEFNFNGHTLELDYQRATRKYK
jgi:hypothetical protein